MAYQFAEATGRMNLVIYEPWTLESIPESAPKPRQGVGGNMLTSIDEYQMDYDLLQVFRGGDMKKHNTADRFSEKMWLKSRAWEDNTMSTPPNLLAIEAKLQFLR